MFLSDGGRSESPFRPYHQQNIRGQYPVVVGRTDSGGKVSQRGGGNSIGEGSLMNQALTRAERIQQLRMAHQKQHRSRHGLYPMDQQEELYEQQIMEEERRVCHEQ